MNSIEFRIQTHNPHVLVLLQVNCLWELSQSVPNHDVAGVRSEVLVFFVIEHEFVDFLFGLNDIRVLLHVGQIPNDDTFSLKSVHVVLILVDEYSLNHLEIALNYDWILFNVNQVPNHYGSIHRYRIEILIVSADRQVQNFVAMTNQRHWVAVYLVYIPYFNGLVRRAEEFVVRIVESQIGHRVLQVQNVRGIGLLVVQLPNEDVFVIAAIELCFSLVQKEVADASLYSFELNWLLHWILQAPAEDLFVSRVAVNLLQGKIHHHFQDGL